MTRLAVAVSVAAAFAAVVLTSSMRAPAASPTTFAAGSLIIPMDADTSANHASFNQNLGMWKAYGLVYRLLQNGIPVRWGIKESKTAITEVDVSAASVRDKRTGTALGAWDYRGGPFIVDSADAARALPIITAWWAANGNQPNVHEALTGFDANVDVTMRSAPRIANEAINAGISIAYYNAAGIPDLNGNPWSTSSPNILDEAEIAAGGLFVPGTTCPQRRFDTFVTPHNSGYAYSLTDPTNIGTRTYAQLDAFVQDGGGWTALCHSILSNENNISDLTRNGSPAVKSLFKTSLVGGLPGGFLTTNGFPVIDNTGGTATINPTEADLPTAQMAPVDDASGAAGRVGADVAVAGQPGCADLLAEHRARRLLRHAGGRSRQHHRRHVPRRHRRGEADLHRRPFVLDVAPLQRQLRGCVPAGVLQLAVLQRRRRRQARPDLLAEHVPAERHGAAEREHRQHGRQRRDRRPRRRPHARARLHLRLDDVRAGSERQRADADVARRASATSRAARPR